MFFSLNPLKDHIICTVALSLTGISYPLCMRFHARTNKENLQTIRPTGILAPILHASYRNKMIGTAVSQYRYLLFTLLYFYLQYTHYYTRSFCKRLLVTSNFSSFLFCRINKIYKNEIYMANRISNMKLQRVRIRIGIKSIAGRNKRVNRAIQTNVL